MAEYWGFEPDSGSALFISYNSPEWERVAPIAKALKDMGYAVWYDYGLEAGTVRWKTQISASIDSCRAAIVFVTKGLFERERSYVLNEHDEAAGIRKTVIPVFLDSVDLASVPVKYRAYVTEWQQLRGVPYAEETPEQTAKRIAGVLGVYDRIGYGSSAAGEQAAAPHPATNHALSVTDAPPQTAVKKSAAKTLILTAAALAAVLICCALFLPGPVRDWITGAEKEPDGPTVSVGDVVYFGSYPQTGEGEEKPIEWRVLAVEDGKALMISEYLLDEKPYNDELEDVTWETCSLRAWLNGEFFERAFSEEERGKISARTNDNPNNPDEGTNGGNPTEDKVFLLSIQEERTFFENEIEGAAKITEYAKKKKAWPSGNTYGDWWLRSPGRGNEFASYIDFDGGCGDCGVAYEDTYIRPVILVDL